MCDPNGRYILVTGHVYSHHVTLLNVYALISDHSPTSLVLDLNHKKQLYSLRFHPSLLSDSSFSHFLSARISEFLETNDNTEVTDSTSWEAFKAVIRGHIISFENSMRR